MLKITSYLNGDPILLKLEGVLKGPWVEELSKVWVGRLSNDDGREVVVDVQGVSFADSRGQALLFQMQQEGATFTGLSAFLQFVLEQRNAGTAGPTTNQRGG